MRSRHVAVVRPVGPEVEVSSSRGRLGPARSPSTSTCRAAVSIALATTSAGMLLVGCSGGHTAQPPASSSSSAGAGGLPFLNFTPTVTTTMLPPPAVDYTPLLLKSGEVDDAYIAPAPTRNPAGVTGAEVLMIKRDQAGALGITVVVEADAATARDGLAQAQAGLSTVVPTTPSQAVPVGTGAAVIRGHSPDGLKTVAALVFSQDRAIVRIDFYTRPGVTTPMDFVIEVGQKQAIAVRVGLARLD
jgi:hypothetical protein